MLAEALIKRVVKKAYQDKAYVIALIPEHDSSWHVHRDEEVPADRPVSVRVKLGQVLFSYQDHIYHSR